VLVFFAVVGYSFECWFNYYGKFLDNGGVWNGKDGKFNVVRDDGVEDRAGELDRQVMNQFLGEPLHEGFYASSIQ